MSGRGTLEVEARSPRLLLGVGALVLVVAVGLASWQARNPEPLPQSDELVNATTPTGVPIYLGVVADVGRELHLAGVKVHATSSTDAITITPMLCRGGTIGVTADPEPFCTDLVNPEEQTLGTADSIVLQVVSDQPAIAVVDRVRLAFRDGLQWGTLPAGSEAVVQVIPR